MGIGCYILAEVMSCITIACYGLVWISKTTKAGRGLVWIGDTTTTGHSFAVIDEITIAGHAFADLASTYHNRP